ncbi:hypothetical protein EW146_g2887 [Bondarzewia mesenterica]|uniref:Cyclopropane-fatty-acyl-phospholipid synthase n=1 Tax=Bondarzewia mesenterica TaxID=1095465 RepID=A0A4S4LZI2_9AGAM|nr:hypothetical protein EW146_g2887 [Bondarzewia mesenterica]
MSSTAHYTLPSGSLGKFNPSLSVSFLSPHSLLVAFAYLCPVAARNSILSVLNTSITSGYLEIIDSQRSYCFGRPTADGNTVRLKIRNDEFWIQILLSGDLGFSEAYMMGDVHVSSLKDVMNLWLQNETGMANLTSLYGRVSSALSGLSNALFGQTRANARLNVMSSYDQSNELFKAFLSQEMMYSCALWSDEEGGLRGDLLPGSRKIDGDLEAAQSRKIHLVLRQARVRPGDRILEFGSGWGGLAIEAARSFGCQVDTITLSVEQKKLAEERIRTAGLQDRIRVHLMDYRELPAEFEKAFDAFVSIEMLEHVGSKVHYSTYFKIVDWALKPSNATVVVSSSTFPESRYTGYQAQDFMRKYMWPNSCLPSATALITAARDGSQSRFTLDNVENHSAHYPRTLREWDRRLEANLTPELLAMDFPNLLKDAAAYDAFKRKWRYLFAYAGAGQYL